MCVSGPSIEAKRYTHMKSLSSKQRYKEIHISVATDPSTVIKSTHMPCCSVAKLCLTLRPHELQHTRLPFSSLSPRVCSNSCPLSQWCHPITSSSVALFSSCPQSFSASGSFPMSWLFASGGQSTGASASASVFPMNIQGWFSLGLTGLISLPPKGLSDVFSRPVWKHQFSGAQPSLWSNSLMCTWLLEKP